MGNHLQAIVDIWQPASEETLTGEDAREIAENVFGFFKVLEEWAGQDALPNARNSHQD